MPRCVFGTRNLNPDSVIQIHTAKKVVWYKIFEWGLKSQLEFYVGPMSNLSSAFGLFLNPSRIQIRIEFMCGSQFIIVTGPRYFFSLHFLSLSSRCFPLSFSQPLQRAEPLHTQQQQEDILQNS